MRLLCTLSYKLVDQRFLRRQSQRDKKLQFSAISLFVSTLWRLLNCLFFSRLTRMPREPVFHVLARLPRLHGRLPAGAAAPGPGGSLQRYCTAHTPDNYTSRQYRRASNRCSRAPIQARSSLPTRFRLNRFFIFAPPKKKIFLDQSFHMKN